MIGGRLAAVSGLVLGLLLVAGVCVAPCFAAEVRYYAPPSQVKATLQTQNSGTVLFREATGGFSYDAEASTLGRVKVALATGGLTGGQDFYRQLEAHVYPEITFASGPSVAVKDGKAEVAGTLTLHGVGKAVTMTAVVSPADSGHGVGLALSTSVKLADFGMGADSATVLFELQAIKP